MYCQFEQLKERNVHVKCFNQALYHVSSAKPELQNYCEFHISRLPRKTKLELLFDVIELPPSLNPSENDETIATCSTSAGLVTSNSDSSSSDVQILKATDCDSKAEGRDFTYINFNSRKSKSEFTRPFKNLGELCECYGYLPRPKTWRMLPYAIPGEINGLHNTRGMALATNGIHVAIENSACE